MTDVLTEPQTDFKITAGIPAIDHHSHAAYVRPGETPGGFDLVEREFAAGHIEANIPADAYTDFVAARTRGDKARVDSISEAYGIEALVQEGIGFYSTTAFASALRDGCRRIYGDIPREEQLKISRERQGTDYPAFYNQALELAGTPMVLTDIPSLDRKMWDPEKYKQIARIDPYLYPFGHEEFPGRGSDTPRFQRIFSTILADLLSNHGLEQPPESLADYLEFVRASVRRRTLEGVVGLKIASAYVRSLDFRPRDTHAAETAYRTLRSGTGPVEGATVTALSDFLVYAIADLAVELGLPMQIHTGMGHSEPGLKLTDANPLLLETFLSTPRLNRLKVILIHGGYPYSAQLAALAQTFGNVYLDFSWMPYLHHHFLRRMLQEWLELLPAHKIMYGTDTGWAELHVAATDRTRGALEYALQSGYSAGLWTAGQVDWLAERVLHGNLADVYGVKI